jgi:uncharacterized membrane protein
VPEIIIAAILIGVFVVFAGIFLLCYALFQVSKMHKAIAEAGQRIEKLEGAVSQIAVGAAPSVRIAPPETASLPRAAAEEQGTPPAEQGVKPAPIPEPVATTQPGATPPPSQPQPQPQPQTQPQPKPAPQPAPVDATVMGEEWPWGGIGAAGAALLVLLLGANQVISATPTAMVGFGIGAMLMAAGFSRFAGGRVIAPPLGASVMAIALAVAAGPLDFAPDATIFLALSAVCILAAALSPWSGRLLAAVAAIAGAAAPLMIPLGVEGALARYGHLIALTAALLLAASYRTAYSGWALATVGAALAWGVVDAIQGVPMAATYLSALGVVGLCLLWDDAKEPGALSTLWARLQSGGETTKVGAAMTLAAAALLVITVWRAPDGATGVQAAAGLLVMAALTHAASAIRPGYAGYALVLAGMGTLVILAWPLGQGLPETRLSEAHTILSAVALLALLGVAAGWREAQAPGREGNAIAFGAIAPLAAIAAAALRLQGAEMPWLAAGAIAVAVSSALMAHSFTDQEGVSTGATAARATGMAIAGAAAAVAVAGAAPEEWRAVALAGLSPALIFIDKQRGGAALTGAAVLVAAAALALLLSPWAAASSALGETPLFNMLAPIYGAAAMFFYVGARMLADAKWRSAPLARQCLLAATWVTGAAFLSMQVRHAFSAAAMTTPVTSLAELGLHATVWIGLGLALRVSDRAKPTQPFALTEGLAVSVGVAFAVLGSGILLNPWWGTSPAVAPTTPIMNDLMAGFGLPAGALTLYALACASEGQPWRAKLAGTMAGLLGFLYLILELRRGFAGPAMATAAQSQLESFTYTGAVLACAVVLLLVGMERKSFYMKAASLGLVLLGLSKALLIDLSALSGGMRVLTALGILAAGALAWRFYQRHIFKIAPPSSDMAGDANPAPRP